MRHKRKPHRCKFQSSFWRSQGVQQLLIFNVQSFWPSRQNHIKLFQRCLGSHQTSGRFESIFQVGIGTSRARETSYLVIAWGSSSNFETNVAKDGWLEQAAKQIIVTTGSSKEMLHLRKVWSPTTMWCAEAVSMTVVPWHHQSPLPVHVHPCLRKIETCLHHTWWASQTIWRNWKSWNPYIPVPVNPLWRLWSKWVMYKNNLLFVLFMVASPDLTMIWVVKARAPSTWNSSKMLIIPNHSSNQSLRQCMEFDASFTVMFLSLWPLFLGLQNQEEQWDNVMM